MGLDIGELANTWNLCDFDGDIYQHFLTIYVFLQSVIDWNLEDKHVCLGMSAFSHKVSAGWAGWTAGQILDSSPQWLVVQSTAGWDAVAS